MKYSVAFNPIGKTIDVEEGTSILDAALNNDIDLNHACGGYCACTTCHVIIKEGENNLSEPEEDELDRLDSKSDSKPNSRLACQAKIRGNIQIEIP